MKNLFVDVETTGLNPAISQVVEIAIINETGRCLLSTRYAVDLTLNLQHINDINTALEYNKLSFNELALYTPLNKYGLMQIAALLAGNKVIAHNSEFDKAFLEAASDRVLGYNCFNEIPWDCSMKALAKSKGIKSGRIKLPCMSLDSIAHSALSDAQNCRLLWQSLTEEKNNDWQW